MLRRLGIRGKVLAALSVPVLVLFVLAGAVSAQAIDDVQTSRTVTQLLSALDRTRELTAAMQDERAATLAVVTAAPEERADASAELGRVRATTNDAIGAASREAAEIELGALTDRAVTGLRDQLTELDTLRRAVDSGDVTMRLAFTGYTTVVERVTAFPEVVANALDDRELAAIITGQTAVASLAEKYEQEQVFGNEVLQGSARSGPDLQLLAALFPATDIQQESAALAVAQLQLGIEVPGLVTGLQTYGNFRSLATSGQENYLSFIDPAQWVETSQGQIDLYAPVVADLSAAEEAQADEVAANALRTAVLTIALTVLAVIISIAVALTIARQIVNPLRRLTRAAGEVREELPRLVDQVAIPGQGPDLTLAHIPVTSRDEIGQLATAFNDVNSTTIQVAQEQAALRGSIAEMFVNVARRDQVLLNRQLSFIDALERSEEDPKTLADLFRLDHLATRMRRNAESLLVLAGIDTGRRLRETLPTSDVIRTASSEIEHYERVQLDLPVDPTMLGHTALPAAHLLAELLENATVFSDPGTPVQVSTGVDEHHVLVTVLDQGLGMTPEEILDANTKIRTTSAGDVLGAQRLGLFVVGRIANRLGAVVELAHGPSGTGTLATVRFPVSLFVDASGLPPTAPAHSAATLPPAQSPALPAAPSPAQIA
uniref:nitrate- and nitrite sensing domain-containing protein n=1 Tax=Actinotalea sp. C106 TaxID=2908644 RepID=UPI002027F4A7